MTFFFSYQIDVYSSPSVQPIYYPVEIVYGGASYFVYTPFYYIYYNDHTTFYVPGFDDHKEASWEYSAVEEECYDSTYNMFQTSGTR